MSEGYDFGQLYGMADHSGSKPLETGQYDAIVETAEWGRTKDGTKGAWTIKFRVTTGERANTPITMTMAVNPVKSDGEPNPQGMGIMFRQLHAMGIPVGPPVGPPTETPFWAMGWTEANVAQAISGRPVLLRVATDDKYDGTPRAKVTDIRDPRPGAPLQVQQAPPQQQAAMPGYGGQGSPYAQNGQWGQQPQASAGQWGQQTGYGPGGVAPQGYVQPQAAQGPTAPGAWQNAQQGPPQGQPSQQMPGTPAWAQPPAQNQGGYQQGQPYQQQPQQSAQPQYAQGGQAGPGAPGMPGPAQQGYGQQPGQAPQAQFQPPAGQPPQQQPNQQPQGAPELPPWAQ